MQRRTFIAGSTALVTSLVLAMSGCSGPILRSAASLPPESYTPAAVAATLVGKTNVRELVALYGQPTRLMNDPVRHPEQKGYVWEYVETRPSLHSNPAERDGLTPTIKKEIHVWRRPDGRLTDAEVVGTTYVQKKLGWLPLMIDDLRPLTDDEVASTRIPAAPGEHPDEVDAWYRARGR